MGYLGRLYQQVYGSWSDRDLDHEEGHWESTKTIGDEK